MVCLLRYAQVIEHSHRCWVNTSALVSGCTNAVGLVMVGNFQVNLSSDDVSTINSNFADLLLFFFFFGSECKQSFWLYISVLTGWSCQISTLCGCWGGISSRAVVCVPAVCAHLPGSCNSPWLLDGPFPGGAGTGSYGLPRPQYPHCSPVQSSPVRWWHGDKNIRETCWFPSPCHSTSLEILFFTAEILLHRSKCLSFNSGQDSKATLLTPSSLLSPTPSLSMAASPPCLPLGDVQSQTQPASNWLFQNFCHLLIYLTARIRLINYLINNNSEYTAFTEVYRHPILNPSV